MNLVKLGMGISYTPNDKWAQKAKSQNYRARSVYKLKELDQRFHLLLPGMKVLDLAAAPGSWLQYASEKVGKLGAVTGIDLQEIAPIRKNVTTIVADINEWQPDSQYDLVLSDIAPSTTGVAKVDEHRSVELNRVIFAIAKKCLLSSGFLVMKIFDGIEFQRFASDLKAYFSEVHVVKAHASRSSSREVYVVCR